MKNDGIVYIKEAWATEKQYDHLKPRELPHTIKIFYLLDGYDSSTMGKWRSPLFMPAWAARDFIKILSVTLQRLWDMTEADAVAEGFQALTESGSGFLHVIPARTPFATCWDSINPKLKWSTNPWVWKYCFELTSSPAGGLER